MQRIFIAFMSLLVLAVGVAVYVLVSTGQFDTVEPAFTGHCVAVEGVPGVEDIVVHPSGNYAFMSSQDRQNGHRGNIFLYDLEKSNQEPINLTNSLEGAFSPLGISFYRDPDGTEKLFVIDRASKFPADDKRSKVRIFLWTDSLLVEQSFQEIEGSPNNILAVGTNQYYLTNDYRYGDSLFSDLQSVLALPISTVSYFDGSTFREVASGLEFANGIAASENGKTVFVAETLGRRISVFDRNPATGQLTLKEEVDLPTAPDNLTRDDQDRIWIAGHPQLLSYYGHQGDIGKLSPSHILQLTKGAANQTVASQLMLDAGDLISGATVAAPIGRRFLVGAAFENKFLDCSL
ncbi:SMP-30/gluconolactonase/LRE family protein [Sneathiella limimaris]|uniref:SMP-30/gluconolactonase/LRE family protein n=1 Tax=Sneathiella limimaris TaxID=1964213 RepID=UPI00146E9A53|nr:SMP-30/gluconolactonase/LRE family protein [Sneathiella limimaris]